MTKLNTPENKKGIIVLLGPTACGKTAVSIELAGRIHAEIVSADSIQVYQKLDIGSAKPTVEEMKGIRHHMIGEIPIDCPGFSVAEYKKMAAEHIDDIIERQKIPLVVGGTGLYIHSLTYAMDFTHAAGDPDIRQRLKSEEQESPGILHKKLSQVDPEAGARIHPNDQKRIIRALEVFEISKKTLSSYAKDYKNLQPPYNSVMIGLEWPREQLYQRIEKRVDSMFEKGLLNEARHLFEEGYNPELPAMQALGYKQLFAYFRGEYTLDDAIKAIKLETRHYAKRQLTWFRRDKRIIWFDVSRLGSHEELAMQIIKTLKEYPL